MSGLTEDFKLKFSLEYFSTVRSFTPPQTASGKGEFLSD